MSTQLQGHPPPPLTYKNNSLNGPLDLLNNQSRQGCVSSSLKAETHKNERWADYAYDFGVATELTELDRISTNLGQSLLTVGR